MKTIFAVSALAAAVSTSAIAADTEWEFEFNGAMEAEFTVDFANDANKDVFLMTDDDEADGWDLNLDMTVTNGPFSGAFVIDAGDEQGGDAVLKLDDITVTEGKFSFGQVGSLMSTDDYLDIEETPIIETALDNNSIDEVYGIDAGFKYEVAEGFTVQLQGAAVTEETTTYEAIEVTYTDPNDPTNTIDDNYIVATTETTDFPVYGAAVQYVGEADALSYVVEAEIALDDSEASALGDDSYIFAGAGVTYSTDAVTAKGYLNYFGADETAVQYGISVETTLAGATLAGLYLEPSSEVDDDEELEVSVSYGVTDEVTVSTAYNYTAMEDSSDEVSAKVAWARDAYKASAELILADIDADDPQAIELDVDASYTSELGVKYYTEFNFQPEEDGANEETNKFTLGAAYAF